MSVFNDKFRKARRDYSPYLFHFINGQDYDPKGTMYKILDELKLKSKNDYICLSASPLTSIGRFFETTVNGTGKPMYQPFGIGFSRDVLVRDFGARNVIYYDDNESELIPEDLKWRALRLNVDTYDFEYLREWRIKGGEFDFSKFPKEHLIVIAPNLHELNDLDVFNHSACAGSLCAVLSEQRLEIAAYPGQGRHAPCGGRNSGPPVCRKTVRDGAYSHRVLPL